MSKYCFVFVWLIALGSCSTSEGTRNADRMFEAGRYQEAIVAYDKYLKLNPSNVKSIYNRGRAYEELGQYEQAKKDFVKALDLDAKHTNAMLSLATYYYRNDQFDQAAYHAQEAIEVNPELPMAYFWLGRSKHQQGIFQAAVRAYNSSINLNDAYGDVYLYRGVVYAQLNNRAKACNDFKIARSLEVEEAKTAFAKYCK